MAKKVNKTDKQFANVEESLTKAGLFVERNQKRLLIGLGSIIAIIAIYISILNFYIAPRENQASSEMHLAEFYFMNNDFDKALNGDSISGSNGFVYISENFGSTDAGNLSNYYSGICQINLGEYENAISSLNDFDTDDEILYSLKTGLIGDANFELGNMEEALDFYTDAATDYVNDFTTPYFMMKQAMLHETNNDYAKSLEIYKTIKSDYFSSREGQDIERYISRASNN